MSKKPNIKTAQIIEPQVYCFTTPGHLDGWCKIGYTDRDAEERINEILHTPNLKHITHWVRRAQYQTKPYDSFRDHDFHAYLQRLGVERDESTEWFHITPDDAENLFDEFIKNHGVREISASPEPVSYVLRNEQNKAVGDAKTYFESHTNGEFLWNCKPRFGKTLAAYDLCRRMKADKILIVTNRPTIANSWHQDYITFLGRKSGYFFVSETDGIKNNKEVYSYSDYLYQKPRPHLIWFISLQDLKGSIYFGGKYDKLQEIANTKWDLLIIDEAHEGVDTFKTDMAFDNIKRKNTLHLSGTPFKALANEKFPNEAIFSWTYADEQKAKREWDYSKGENPYEDLPQLNLFTYKMSDIMTEKAEKGIELAEKDVAEYAFDLNEFFATKGGKFVHEEDVDAFLDALANLPRFPFSSPELRDELKHTFWLLNRVDSAKALEKKLNDHPVFRDYKVIAAVGSKVLDDEATNHAANKKAYDRVMDAISRYDKTITLSVGQLTTGVTVKPWTAVLMLSNMESPALYMQAAFRAQNPYTYTDGKNVFRKENCYVFDFDPARTLDIFEQFANDLSEDTANGGGDTDTRKRHVRDLLNYFPVYGEDSDGEMVPLDAEKILTIPRHIHAKEVVERGFMSNFLFANINRIFGAPSEVVDILGKLEAVNEPKNSKLDEDEIENVHLDENGEPEVPESVAIGLADDIFGDKVYADIDDDIDRCTEELKSDPENIKKEDEYKVLVEAFGTPVTNKLMKKAKEHESGMKKSTEKKLRKNIGRMTEQTISKEYSRWKVKDGILDNEYEKKKTEAQNRNEPSSTISELSRRHEKEKKALHASMIDSIGRKLKEDETAKKAARETAKVMEEQKQSEKRDDMMGQIRDHLRGFSRTIPSFLMAYGTESTTLQTFDRLMSNAVFQEVTGITIEQFRLLRDGGDIPGKDGTVKHFDGHLFDEVVFNDSVKEFMRLRKELADYFDEGNTRDIFDYIPPQKTNQIFTPRKVVREMCDMLEKENPGCFDDPNKTFIDMYMKSGLYITEIVTRLFRSSRMKALYPDDRERLKHIFERQVYGISPTEIIYRITDRYIFGFDADRKISRKHFKKCDMLKYAIEGTAEDEIEKLFGDEL